MKVLVELTDAEYAMLKAFAAARRKHEIGKGYRVENAIAQALSIGIGSIAETQILDKDGMPVEWKSEYVTSEECDAERTIRRKY